MSVSELHSHADDMLRAIADLARAGRLSDAQAAIDTALDEGTPSDALLGLAAMIAARNNDPAAAARHLDILLARRPHDRAVRINLGQALIALGQFDRILVICDPLAGDPAVDRMLAYAAQQVGDLDRASTLYRGIVAGAPNDADSWANFGNVLVALEEMEPAIEAFGRAVAARPSDARLYINLAGALERVDQGERRRQVMRSAARVQPDNPDVQLALGLAEAGLENIGAAEAALRRAIALAPDRGAAWLELGMLLENSNRVEDLETLIDLARPHLGEEIALLDAWVAFRHKRFDAAKMHAANLSDTLNPIRRYHLQGEIADRLGDPAAAFVFFERMNAASRATAPRVPSGPSYRETVVAERDALRKMPRTPRTPRKAPADDFPPPVFIVGFPRSGTTLLDTILGRLPDTHVLEEQPLISAIEHRIGGASNAFLLNREEIAAHRQAYLARLQTIVPELSGKRIVDKHPLHMARMPLIDALFPGAPILFVERHPFDVVLSCFVSNFRLNHAMRSFTDIEEAARTYDAVLSAWTEARDRLDLQVHQVRYERLVTASEDEMRPVLGFIGARYEPGIFDTVAAAKVRGHVRTASYSQVSEPIYQRSVARWERYREQLEPVRSILAPWAERFGYPT